MGIITKILTDIKTYCKINAIYPRRYRDSIIESYIVNENILGDHLIIKSDVNISAIVEQIGSYTYIGNRSEILYCETIGRYCSISHDVKIGLENHAMNHVGTSPLFYAKQRGMVSSDTIEHVLPTKIGDDVLISANAMIMAGINIGTGAVIGAGAFVNKDVPPYAIVAGIPAKIIKYRFDDITIKRLLNSQWWKMPKEELVHYKDQFNNVSSFLENIEK